MAPPWLSGVKAVAQAVAGALPALMLVIFAGVLSLLGLACDEGRRAYALDYADRFVDLAAVLVGLRGQHQLRRSRNGDTAISAVRVVTRTREAEKPGRQ